MIIHRCEVRYLDFFTILNTSNRFVNQKLKILLQADIKW
jgi:hypothetical protein